MPWLWSDDALGLLLYVWLNGIVCAFERLAVVLAPVIR
jgi:hypothetical protein